MSIYGLGGCGKTALALEFIYRILAKHPQYLVFWVPAISRETFELAYRKIGEFLRIPGITEDNADVNQLLKDGLSSNNFGDWLMVVDNADETSVLFDGPQSNRLIDYLPRSDRGLILFTTRSRKTAVGLSKTNILKLEDMSDAKVEARQLIELEILNKELLADSNAINDLLDLLTYLPLAINQAIAFINQNDIQVSEYVSLLRDTDSEAELFGEHFKDPNRYKEMESTIARTWYISFHQIREQDPLAADYLSFMACIGRTNIPLSLLPGGNSALQQIKAIGTLTGYALITKRQQDFQKVQGEEFFDVHRLVHIASKWWLQEYEGMSNWNEKIISRLEDVLPHGGHEKQEIWINYISHAILVAERIESSNTAKVSLLNRIGECQSTLGQYTLAEANYRQVLDLRKEMLGPQHLGTLISMNNLALVLNRQGKYEEAEAMHRQTLDLKEVLGPQHLGTLTSMNNLASVLNSQGKYEEAEAMHRQTLDLKKEVLGLRHPDTLTSMNNLASVLNSQGKYEEAEAMHRQTLDLEKEVQGLRHPNTLTSMNNLASVLDRQGKYEEAEKVRAGQGSHNTVDRVVITESY
ncbi:MAG: hypothetical protein MMC23_003648 [Stictis urceolatum]|nr:hypothetical protein [Stictis urceolata]